MNSIRSESGIPHGFDTQSFDLMYYNDRRLCILENKSPSSEQISRAANGCTSSINNLWSLVKAGCFSKDDYMLVKKMYRGVATEVTFSDGFNYKK